MVIATEGSRAILDCVATGNPTPTVTWRHDSVPLPNPAIPRIQQSANNSLLISGVERSDEGEYLCQASSEAGEATITVELRVYGKQLLSVRWTENVNQLVYVTTVVVEPL